MNPKKTIKPAEAAKPAPLTDAQRLAAIERGFTQQYQSIAQGVLFNLCHGYSASGNTLPAAMLLTKEVLEITDAFMDNIGQACDAAFERIVVSKMKEKEAAE